MIRSIEQVQQDIDSTSVKLDQLYREMDSVKNPRKFRFGERLACNFGECMLVKVFNTTPRLIRISDGQDKAGSYIFDIPIQFDKDGYYITTLPTAFPSDFRLDESYAGKLINGDV